MGTAALVVGVVALVLVVLILFAPLGLVALVLGIVGLVRANRGQADNRGQAVAGLVTGALALVIGLFFAASIGAFFATNVNDFPAVRAAAWTAPAATRPARPAPSNSNAIWIGSNWGLLFTLGRAGAADEPDRTRMILTVRVYIALSGIASRTRRTHTTPGPCPPG